MKYLVLVYFDENEFGALAEDEREALWAEGEAYATELQRLRGFIAADALEPTAAATTLRKRNGTITVTDGPFAETKEQLGGFVLIDAPNLDQAVRIAARVPSARFGSVEVRPVRELEAGRACLSPRRSE